MIVTRLDSGFRPTQKSIRTDPAPRHEMPPPPLPKDLMYMANYSRNITNYNYKDRTMFDLFCSVVGFFWSLSVWVVLMSMPIMFALLVMRAC